MAGLQTSLEFLTSRLDTTVIARQWPTENIQHPGETYQDPGSAYIPTSHGYSQEQPQVAVHEAVEKVATPVVDRPILSRTNSRGERSESPKVKKERRSLTRRESRMSIQKVEYPLPKHPNIEQPQLPQRGTVSTENSYRNDTVQDPAIYRSEIPETHQEYRPTEAIPPDSYHAQEAYGVQGQEIQGYQGQEFQQQDQYPQDYNYPEQQPYFENPQQDNQPAYYPEVEQFGAEPQFSRQEDRAPSRESLRRQYQEDNQMAQSYQPEGYRSEERAPSRESMKKPYQESPPNYTPEMVRQRKSSSGESTGAPQTAYGQPSDVFQPNPSEQPLHQPSFAPEDVKAKPPQQPPYQPPEVFQQSANERQPSYGADEVRTPSKPPQPKQVRPVSGESSTASEQKQTDVPRTKSSPPSAAARREAGTKLLQKMQRNVPTKFQ